MNKLMFFLGLLSISTSLTAQVCKHQLRGKVVHAHTKEELPNVSIVVEDENKGVLSNEHGEFIIDGVCEGEHSVVCSHLGFRASHRIVRLQSDSLLIVSLEPEALHIHEVTVSAEAIEQKSTNTSTVIQGTLLERSRGQGLGEALTEVVGVQTLKTGSSIAKPIIQGLHSNRILILNNGVRQEGQQWGMEHAPEIDPYIADKLTVVKGANSVRYGADAIGGIVLVETKDLPTKKGIHGALNLAGYSNGRQGGASLYLEGRLSDKLPLAGRIQGTFKRGGNLKAPNYFLANTGVREHNFSYEVGYKKERYGINLFYSQFNTELGIFRGAHIGNLTDLENAIQSEVPLIMADFTYQLDRPLQRIMHELTKVKGFVRTGEKGKLKWQYARQFNRRQEFDAHRQFGELSDEFDLPNMEFEITSHSADVVWQHYPIKNFKGEIGVSFIHQRNTTDRGGLIPDYKSYTLGGFWLERWKNYPFPLELEAGIRYDFKRLNIEGRRGEEDQQLDFGNVSGSIGAIYHLSHDWHLNFNFGTAWRSPNISELYSDGVHHGTASYELGRNDLQSELALNATLTVEYDNEKNLGGSLSLYHNFIKNYIYLQPQERPILTIRGAFPAYHYEQTNARLIGADLDFHYHISEHLEWQGQLAIVRGHNLKIDDYLVLMPSDRFKNAIKYEFDEGTILKNSFVKLGMQNVLKQNRIPEGGDFAPAPKGYTLFDLEMGTNFSLGKLPMEVGLNVENLFNNTYRDYLNRFRYFADEPGTNISLRLKLIF